MGIRIYDTYRKVKDVFAKPKIKIYFGLWKNDHNLLIWRDKKLFYFLNSDVYCKSKWEEWRYEFPPQFTIMLFGISFTITLHSPFTDGNSGDSFYWECILEYLYGGGKKSIKGTLECCGKWKRITPKGEYYFFMLRKEYLKKKYWGEYDEAVENMISKQYNNQIII